MMNLAGMITINMSILRDLEVDVKILRTPMGMTVRELKDWLASFPDKNPRSGEDYGVFVDTGENATGPVMEAWPMNSDGQSGDVGLYSMAWSRQKYHGD